MFVVRLHAMNPKSSQGAGRADQACAGEIAAPIKMGRRERPAGLPVRGDQSRRAGQNQSVPFEIAKPEGSGVDVGLVLAKAFNGTRKFCAGSARLSRRGRADRTGW